MSGLNYAVMNAIPVHYMPSNSADVFPSKMSLKFN